MATMLLRGKRLRKGMREFRTLKGTSTSVVLAFYDPDKNPWVPGSMRLLESFGRFHPCSERRLIGMNDMKRLCHTMFVAPIAGVSIEGLLASVFRAGFQISAASSDVGYRTTKEWASTVFVTFSGSEKPIANAQLRGLLREDIRMLGAVMTWQVSMFENHVECPSSEGSSFRKTITVFLANGRLIKKR